MGRDDMFSLDWVMDSVMNIPDNFLLSGGMEE
jgi:hypothetical protein